MLLKRNYRKLSNDLRKLSNKGRRSSFPWHFRVLQKLHDDFGRMISLLFSFFFGYMRLPNDQTLATTNSSLWTSSSLISFQCPSKRSTERATDLARDHTLLTSKVHKVRVVSSINWGKGNSLRASLKQPSGKKKTYSDLKLHHPTFTPYF